ncbi:hypothetical protein AXF42_Ash014255 [Apostasia shenzhenica]|uniref:Myosin-12 n=1 Tax=Apostasia shenzhenica TaxID=1088818 RepID=A0A2I0A1C8_9ASPA|nr:hypothetical protein AXF42_Ash014255 [Apostasia shenzhenica]
MGTPVNIVVGSHVWAEDSDLAWIDGEVAQIKGSEATIITLDGKTVVASLSIIYPKDTEAPPAGVDDMTKLAYLHEPGVLHNLACRFALNEIYTYTGNILIAVNPFRRLPHLYDVHMMEQYKGAVFGELSPHLFAVADACYRAMINEQGSQSILVSGESGAGKTETTKMLMRYLAFMGGRSGGEGRTVEQQVLESNPVLEAFGNAKTVKNNNSSRFGKFVEIQFDKYGKISGAAVRTYLLERSRVCQVSDPERNYHCFYMLCCAPPEIDKLLSSDSRPRGAACTVVTPHLTESNGTERSDRPIAQQHGHCPDHARQFNHIRRSSQANNMAWPNCSVRVGRTAQPDHVVGMTGQSSRSTPFLAVKCLAHRSARGTLLLGHERLNFLFQGRVAVSARWDREDSPSLSPLDPGAYSAQPSAGRVAVSARWDREDPPSLSPLDPGARARPPEARAAARRLRMCRAADAIFRVVAAILHLGNIEFAKGTEIDSSKVKDEKAAYHLRTAADLLMCNEKALEESLCERVIVTPDGNITKPLDPESAALSRDALAKTVYSRLFDWIVDKINISIGQDANAKSIIGVLDIYGFESFKINSFEQLCINLTNEKLQQHFNQHVFKMEQEEYTREEINWSYVEFVDNQDVLDLIEKKPGGIIALLDEACMFPKSTHETFAQKMYQIYKGYKRFSKPKLARTAFTINHYAGDVTYQADQFLDKNKDYVVAEHQALLNASTCPFVANLFPPLPEETSKQSKFSSIGTRFKQQLQSLMETLSTTEPHYIRCIKPNSVLKPSIFENVNVLNQLRCGGVLEAIRISCAGYPTKRAFDEFIDRFGMLASDLIDGSDEKLACAVICDRMGLKGYQIGKNKIFLRAGQMAELDARRIEVLANAARRIQRQIRTHLTRKQFLILRNSTIHIQKLWRGWLARRIYQHMRRIDASIRIQKYSRGFAVRVSYNKLRSSAIVIQTGMHALAARNEFRHRRRTKAAIVIQTQWRLHKARKDYIEIKKGSLIVQCLWRGRLGRKELRKLRMAARETGALKEAKDKLEKKVEELTWRIEFEKHLRIDLEEAKKLEITRLQSSLQEMQEKLDEATAAIIKEKETARIAIENAPPVIKEVPVVDNTKLELLTIRNKELEDELSEFKIKAEEFEKRYYESQRQTVALVKETEESHIKLSHLQDMIESLETNLSSLESENQVLRQQALVASTNEELAEEIKRPLKFDGYMLPSLESKIADLEYENKLLHSKTAKAAQQTLTIDTIDPPVTQILENGCQEPGLSKIQKETIMIPMASALIKQKSLTDRQQENHDTLIRCLIEDKRFDKKRPAAAYIVYKSLLQWHIFETEKTNIFDRIIYTIRSYVESTRSSSPELEISSGYSGMSSKTEDNPRVEAKYPALLFKQQLTGYVEKIYGMIRDRLKKDISPFVTMCIQVHSMIIRKIFNQVFAFVNVQLFNSLLLRRECCSSSNGEFLKAGLHELEEWCSKATEEVGTSWDELQHIRQAVGFLVLHQKAHKSSEEITIELYPVIGKMRAMMTDESAGVLDTSFLLDDDSSYRRPDRCVRSSKVVTKVNVHRASNARLPDVELDKLFESE